MTDREAPATTGTWPPAFSDSFVAQCRELLAQRPALVLVGPAGSSRNRLAEAVAAGAPSAQHVCHFGEQDVDFGVVRQVFGVDERVPLDVEAVARAIGDDLRTSPGPRPTVVLSHANLCDPASIEVLIRLTVDGAVAVIATITPGTVPADWPLLALAERLDIPPLDLPRVTQLLRARFGCEPHPAVAELLLQRSGGVYGILQQVADAARAAGVVVPLEGVLVLEPDDAPVDGADLDDLVQARRPAGSPTPEPVRDLLDLAAVIGRLDAAEVREVVGGAALDEALALGRLVLRDGSAMFASSAEATSWLRTIAEDRLGALLDAYAGRLPVSTSRLGVAARVAEWWRAAGRALPVDLAARATREANLGRHLRQAVLFSEPSGTEGGVVVAPTERMLALLELGDTERVRATFDATDPRALDEDDLLPWLRWVGRLVDGPERDRLLDRALQADDTEDRRRRAAVARLGALLDRVFQEGGEELIDDLRSLTFSAHLSPLNRSMAFSALSAAHRQAGQPAQAVDSADHALALIHAQPQGPSAFHLDLAQELRVLALLTCLDGAEAEEALRDYSRGLFDHPGSGRIGAALRTLLEMFRGESEQALVSARLSLAGLERHDPRQMRGWVEALLSQVLVQCGRPDEAVELLAASKSHPSSVRVTELEAHIVQACAHDALGEPEEAIELLEQVRAEARRHGFRMAEVDASLLLVQIGGPVFLRALLDSVDDLVEPSGTPAVWQAFARAAQRYDIAALVTMAVDLDERGAHLFAAEVAQFVLDIARRATDLDPDTRDRLERLADPTLHRRPRG